MYINLIHGDKVIAQEDIVCYKLFFYQPERGYLMPIRENIKINTIPYLIDFSKEKEHIWKLYWHRKQFSKQEKEYFKKNKFAWMARGYILSQSKPTYIDTPWKYVYYKTIIPKGCEYYQGVDNDVLWSKQLQIVERIPKEEIIETVTNNHLESPQGYTHDQLVKNLHYHLLPSDEMIQLKVQYPTLRLRTKTNTPLIAEEDIKCYKILYQVGKNKRMETTHPHMVIEELPYVMDVTEQESLIYIVNYENNETNDKAYDINGGFIKSFQEFGCAPFSICNGKKLMVECIIPKGTPYFVGENGDLCSKKLYLVRKLTRKERKSLWTEYGNKNKLSYRNGFGTYEMQADKFDSYWRHYTYHKNDGVKIKKVI